MTGNVDFLAFALAGAHGSSIAASSLAPATVAVGSVVGGKVVANVGDMRKALSDAKAQGKHQVLMRVKMGDATRFVALPLGNA